MSASTLSSGPWRIGARPGDLFLLSASFDRCADSIASAARRCASSAYISPIGVARLADVTRSIGNRVNDVGRKLDAADLSTRLREMSVRLRFSMRSRGLRFPSRAARRLGVDGARQFLRIDAEGHGAVVEVFGELDGAEHVAVIIPGMTNSLRNYDANLRVKGLDLVEEMRRQSPNVAVVSWLGYRTPDLSLGGLVDAAASDRARVGSAALVSDLEVIRRMAPRSHLTVVGHSYGSVVVGETLKSGTLRDRVDAVDIGDIAVVGSPGMNVSSRSSLRHSEIDIWAAKVSGIDPGHLAVKLKPRPMRLLPWLLPFSVPVRRRPPVEVSVDFSPPRPRDAVPYAPVHGEDPAARGFGAKRFSAAGARSHGDYFRPGTLSLVNLARIATDRTPLDRAPRRAAVDDDAEAEANGGKKKSTKPTERVAKLS